MPSIPTLTSCTGSNASVSWSPSAIRTSVLDTTNPVYPRLWRLDNQFVTLAHGSSVAGIELSAILPALLALVPALTWPPLITVQPANVVNAVPTAGCTFSVTATSEITETYQWQVSVDGGSFSNLSNGGVYSNVTTATMSISANNGLSGNAYLCIVTNASGSTTSKAGILTTDPMITTQPVNKAVVHPASTSFTIVASGQSSITYDWQVSTDSGSTWTTITTAGTPVYGGYTTATLTIGTTATGLNGYEYRCQATDSNGVCTSTAATLTVT